MTSTKVTLNIFYSVEFILHITYIAYPLTNKQRGKNKHTKSHRKRLLQAAIKKQLLTPEQKKTERKEEEEKERTKARNF